MDSRKALVGTGGSIMALSAGLFASGWPAFITAHAWIVWTGFAVGGGLLIWGLAQAPKHLESSGAPALNAPVHVEVNPVFNNSPTANQTGSPTQINQQQNSPPHAAEAEPKLTAVQHELITIYWDFVQWEKRAGTLPIGIVLWVSNEPGAYGEKNEPIRSAVATVVYKANGNTVQHISRAFWLDESANEIFLDVGDRKGLIVAAVPLAGDVWMAYNNPRRQEWRAPTRIGRSFNFPPSPQPLSIKFGEELEIDVTIVSLATMQTALRCRLLITRDDNDGIEISLEKLE